MNCLEIINDIISSNNLENCIFRVIEHGVGINWRVKYKNDSEKIHNLPEGLAQDKPLNKWEIKGSDLLANRIPIKMCPDSMHTVLSLCSKIITQDYKVGHLALMNLHPNEGLVADDVIYILEEITDKIPARVIYSGRYYHYYGYKILNEEEWLKFMAQFLMPTLIVSPRYIGHCIYRGYATLRITTDSKYKPILPNTDSLMTRK